MPGKLADLVVISLDEPQSKPFNRALGALVYHGRGSDVEMTIIDGKIVYEGGSSTLVDEAAVMEEVQARAEELFERLELTRYKTHWHIWH
jgi:5-methylthioadenosine/S-adenosylhomocysteine deaminase